MCRISVQCVPNRGPGRKSIDLNRSLAGRKSIVYGPIPIPIPIPRYSDRDRERKLGKIINLSFLAFLLYFLTFVGAQRTTAIRPYKSKIEKGREGKKIEVSTLT